jgi:putative transposase
LYKTILVKARFTEEELAFWVDQGEHANSLINSAIYETRQRHYAMLHKSGDAYSVYWRDDELRYGWKTYHCKTTYPEFDKILKDNPHYKAMAAQSAQQTLKSVGESITSYNGLVNAYYKGDVDKPSLPLYRKKGGLAAVTFPRQALNYKDGSFYPSI